MNFLAKAEQAQYDRARYELRLEYGECARCAEKLPPNWPRRTCYSCLKFIRDWTRKRYWAKRGQQPPTIPQRFGPRPAPSPSPGVMRERPEEATPGCIRCGLRGDHVCLRGDAGARKAWL